MVELHFLSFLESNLVHGILNGTRDSCKWLGLETIHGKRTRLGNLGLVLALATKFLHRYTASFNHTLFRFADPDTRIVALLVGLVGAVGVTNLALQVVVLAGFKLAKSIPVGPLRIRVNVHFDYAVLDRRGNFFIGRSRSTVHHQKDGFVISTSQLFLSVGLMFAQTVGLERHIARLVHAVDIAKGSGNREHVANLGESLVNTVDLFR